jgi:hypothetical protein
MNTLNLVAVGGGFATVVGAGFLIMGDYLTGGILIVLGIANIVRFVQLWRD